ncbi:transport protein Avl9-domain-containing protein [Elsinoe ampelina]|uniref:Transport protein Avl9-domain-containing protein n=1 Tax=Elsinoe ampelina TaxID=302913 RepID=A0A6A6GH69_9PEZI|nr:transport protein Avl9-domain-containing protein [Elsinoe ampelina]
MTAPSSFTPIVSVVDFHHARGPEVEKWYGVAEGTDPAEENDWGLLPFLALSDGAHLSAEDFSYFTLIRKSTPPTSLFGISCTRQIDASELLNKSPEVTRSAVQKAVVVITDSPQSLSAIREKLSMVTRAWFAQKDFTDCEILQGFQQSLAAGIEDHSEESDNLLGFSLREIVHTYKWQTLVLFKCLLLQPKMLFFGTHCEDVCMIQFSLLSLIPGLMRALKDCADPGMDTYGANLQRASSLKTSDRQSLLSYMGLPLQIFGKGSLFGPYTPLQQLDTLADANTKSYVVGSTNSLLLQQRDRYADVLVNLDDQTTSIYSTTLKSALTLSVADRRWMDFLTQSVNDTWDPENPSRPSTMGYAGSEEFLRLQFEEYLLALLSSIKYHDYAFTHSYDTKALLTDVEGDPALEFSADFITAWTATENYTLFNRITDSHLFDVIEPRHPCAGGLTIEDVQRRLTAQVAELHLDERWRGGKEALAKNFAEGQKRIGGFIGGVWADVEAMREAQRKKAEEQRAANPPAPAATAQSQGQTQAQKGYAFQKPDLTGAQAQVQAAGARAGAYLSSWGSWAAEKRKAGWGGKGAQGGQEAKTPVTSELGRAAAEKPVMVTRDDAAAVAGARAAMGQRASTGLRPLFAGTGAGVKPATEVEQGQGKEGEKVEGMEETGVAGVAGVAGKAEGMEVEDKAEVGGGELAKAVEVEKGTVVEDKTEVKS